VSARSSVRLAQIAGLALTLGAGAMAQAAEPTAAAAPVKAVGKQAATKPAPIKDVAAELAADAELLEFLGGADGELEEDGDWLDFLASTDIRKLAGAKK
jgi:hypothetical protein